jgi:hypothetical protein
MKLAVLTLCLGIVLLGCSVVRPAASPASTEPDVIATFPPDVRSLAASTDPSPIGGVAHFQGESFSFDYPADWRIISGYQHFGEHGPTLLVAVGTGDFELGCATAANSVTCDSSPTWAVGEGRIVLAYRFDAWLGSTVPESTPSLRVGDEWFEVDGRSAIFSRTDGSMIWHFPGAPESIEARWGPELNKEAPSLVEIVVASWAWDLPTTE